MPGFADSQQGYIKGGEIILWLQRIWTWIPNRAFCLNSFLFDFEVS